MNLSDSDIERFQEKVTRGDRGCWPWIAYRNKKGYGVFGLKDRKTALAHRVAYWLAHGPYDLSLCVCHRCDNPACCNPDHLWLGTQQDNQRDMYRKGRGKKARGVKNGWSKLTPEQVRLIRGHRRLGWSQQRIADKFGIYQTLVSKILLGYVWTHVEGYKIPSDVRVTQSLETPS